jgi:hypothetical protein
VDGTDRQAQSKREWTPPTLPALNRKEGRKEDKARQDREKGREREEGQGTREGKGRRRREGGPG